MFGALVESLSSGSCSSKRRFALDKTLALADKKALFRLGVSAFWTTEDNLAPLGLDAPEFGKGRVDCVDAMCLSSSLQLPSPSVDEHQELDLQESVDMSIVSKILSRDSLPWPSSIGSLPADMCLDDAPNEDSYCLIVCAEDCRITT